MKPSEIRCLGGLQLQLQLVRDEGDELRVGGFAFGIADCVPEEPLQGIQATLVLDCLRGALLDMRICPWYDNNKEVFVNILLRRFLRSGVDYKRKTNKIRRA